MRPRDRGVVFCVVLRRVRHVRREARRDKLWTTAGTFGRVLSEAGSGLGQVDALELAVRLLMP